MQEILRTQIEAGRFQIQISFVDSWEGVMGRLGRWALFCGTVRPCLS